MSYVRRFIFLLQYLPVFLLVCGCPRANVDPVAGETRTFDGIEFQWCPPGTFIMGSPGNEFPPDSWADEPDTRHEVTLTQGFWLGKYEVTEAQWLSHVQFDPWYMIRGNKYPVVQYSWNAVQDFVGDLNASVPGSPYRLPTEAEWEYACRAGTSTRFYWGSDTLLEQIDSNAWYGYNSGNVPHPVGLKDPNDWGLYDMSGNVAEMCQDWYGPYPEGEATDPQGPERPGSGDLSELRVIRGGSYGHLPIGCGSATRESCEEQLGNSTLGFRLVRMAN